MVRIGAPYHLNLKYRSIFHDTRLEKDMPLGMFSSRPPWILRPYFVPELWVPDAAVICLGLTLEADIA
jgi:hypothetical protein